MHTLRKPVDTASGKMRTAFAKACQVPVVLAPRHSRPTVQQANRQLGRAHCNGVQELFHPKPLPIVRFHNTSNTWTDGQPLTRRTALMFHGSNVQMSRPRPSWIMRCATTAIAVTTAMVKSASQSSQPQPGPLKVCERAAKRPAMATAANAHSAQHTLVISPCLFRSGTPHISSWKRLVSAMHHQLVSTMGWSDRMRLLRRDSMTVQFAPKQAALLAASCWLVQMHCVFVRSHPEAGTVAARHSTFSRNQRSSVRHVRPVCGATYGAGGQHLSQLCERRLGSPSSLLLGSLSPNTTRNNSKHPEREPHLDERDLNLSTRKPSPVTGKQRREGHSRGFIINCRPEEV